MIKLNYNPITKESNFQEFKRKICNYALQHLPHIKEAIAAGRAKVFEAPPEPAANASAAIVSIYAQRMKEYSDELKEWKNSNRKFLGILLDNIPPRMVEKLETNATYITAYGTNDGIAVWNLIVATIILTTTTIVNLTKSEFLIKFTKSN